MLQNASFILSVTIRLLFQLLSDTGYISEQDVETLKQWRIDPSAWGLNR